MARDGLRKSTLRRQSAPGADTPPTGPSRNTSSGSFHAGAPIPTLASFRRQPSHRYQTFPTPPPKTPLEQPGDSEAASSESDGGDEQDGGETPLPVKQLLLLAFLSLSEQTALNSISPYLPEMVSSMPGIPLEESGLYVGIIASAFALAQLSTNFLWGYASDIFGRKPVLLLGSFALMCCFCIFGLCTRYWQIVVVHVAMGLLNGNAACVPTVLGEVTDRSNQSKAFTYLPVIYSLGSITGPALGGILVGKVSKDYPYLGPNILGAAMLAASVIVLGIWFEETLDTSGPSVWRPAWVERLSRWMSGQSRAKAPRPNSWSSRWPRGQSTPPDQDLLSPRSSASDDDEDEGDTEETPMLHSNDEADGSAKLDDVPECAAWKDLLNRTTLLLLTTYLVFQLSNISFNSLYPIFAAAPPPTGRDLGPGKIGVSLSLAGVATIVFQAFLYQPLKARLGNLGTYRFAILGIAVSMVLMPWIGYKDGKARLGIGSGKGWLYAELGIVLVMKNICAVGGLSSVMLLVSVFSNHLSFL
jgi:MFS family permease